MLRARLPAVYPESARTCTSSEAHGRTLKRRVERIIFSIKNTSSRVCRDVLTFKRAPFEVQGHFSFLCQVAKPLATLSIRKLQNKAQVHFIGGRGLYIALQYTAGIPQIDDMWASVGDQWHQFGLIAYMATPDNTDSIISHGYFSHVTYSADSKIRVVLQLHPLPLEVLQPPEHLTSSIPEVSKNKHSNTIWVTHWTRKQ